MLVSAIVAHDKNRVIGKDGDIPWHLPADLKYFKRTTLNHHIIMGRVTFDSIGFPLPKRTNIILSRNPFYLVSNCLIANTLQQALELAYDAGEEEVFVIGGAKIYDLALPLLDKLYITEVDTIVEGGDTYFPPYDLENWNLIKEDARKKDDKNPFDYTFKTYTRK